MDKRELSKKLHDAVFGLAIGDALGVPYEFKPRGSFECTGMVGYGAHGQPEGTWSDDTSMAIATAKSIKEKDGKIDIFDMRDKFVAWADDEDFNCNGYCFDIGGATWAALSTGESQTGEGDNGNGSLMRILPVAFAECTDEEVCEVSAITHGHEISMHACLIYVRIARRLLDGEDIHDIIPTLQYEKPFDRLRVIDQLPEDEIRSTGFVVHTLEAALWCLAKCDSFRDTVLAAVNLGDDTDTTGAVAGGLAGIVYGVESDFAKECLEVLRSKEMIEECLW